MRSVEKQVVSNQYFGLYQTVHEQVTNRVWKNVWFQVYSPISSLSWQIAERVIEAIND